MVGSVDTRRPPLTRERVLRAGVELADRAGLGSLTMRNLGAELGVQAMSLYNHVTNKEDLLDGMVDLIFAEIAGGPGAQGRSSNWRTVLRRRAVAARSVLSQHRWAVGLMDSSISPGASTMKHFEDVLGCLRRAGFSVEMTLHAYGVVFAYVYGFVLAVQRGDHTRQVRQIIDMVGAQQYPYSLEATSHFMRRSRDSSGEFLGGLDLILDGIERNLDSPAI